MVAHVTLSDGQETPGAATARRGFPWKKVGILLGIAVVVALFFAFDLQRHLSLDALKAGRASLFEWYQAHQALAIGAFILLYTVQTAVSLPGAMILTLTGGAIFGAVAGTFLVNVGATAGATLAALLARHLFRDFVERKLGDRVRKVSDGFAQNGLSYLLFLRFIPLFPFWFVNLAAGLTRLPMRKYVIGTALGILPGSFVYAYAGSQLRRIDTATDIVSPGMLVAFVLLGLLSLAPVVYDRFIKEHYGEDAIMK